MDDICRLCCSTAFVNNDIFDEENALFLKMSLYLPIKIFRNDQLPQKICDKCSCKVNDFYQFCNETIEVQTRLREMCMRYSGTCTDQTVDLSLVKRSASPPPTSLHTKNHCDRSTQTDVNDKCRQNEEAPLEIKQEPMINIPSPVKKEEDHYDDMGLDSDTMDNGSSDSDDISLISLKSKTNKINSVNGEITQKKGRKKNSELGWETLMSVLPEAALSVVERNDVPDLEVRVVKEEIDDQPSLQHSAINVFNCCICLVQCYTKNEMLRHYTSQHASETVTDEAPAAPPAPDIDPLRCARCRKEVPPGEWAAHWQRHWVRDRKPYRCALCEKAFRNVHQILKHSMTHNYGESASVEPLVKRFVCDLCPEGFVYMKHLLAHRTRAHPEAAGRALALRCGQCMRTFAHINSLRRHLRAHSGERNFLCNVCGKALSSGEHLKFHIRIHTGYKPNVCKTCGKGFVKKCNLTLHERVHSGEKPHVCSHCGKAFSQRSTLVIHERYHSGARPYLCSLCGRGFVAKGLLSMHLKTTCI